MNNREIAPTRATCTQTPPKPGNHSLTPAAVIVIIVLLLTTTLTTTGTPVQTVITTLTAGGLLGIELVRRLLIALTTGRF